MSHDHRGGWLWLVSHSVILAEVCLRACIGWANILYWPLSGKAQTSAMPMCGCLCDGVTWGRMLMV